jgi:hypothetical protein
VSANPQLSDRERERRERQRAESLAQNAADRVRGRNHQSYTVAEWCALRRISKAMFYKLRKQGKAPRLHNAGVKQLISPEADEDWITEREAEAAENSA